MTELLTLLQIFSTVYSDAPPQLDVNTFGIISVVLSFAICCLTIIKNNIGNEPIHGKMLVQVKLKKICLCFYMCIHIKND